MWSDNEAADDLLGFQVHADLIRSVVTDSKMLPVTIGVFGDWGGGKTSIMKMLERDLEADPPHGWLDSSEAPHRRTTNSQSLMLSDCVACCRETSSPIWPTTHLRIFPAEQ